MKQLLLLTASSRSQDYWFQSRQPLPCLIFLLPLLAVYEFGVLYLGGSDTAPLRNGADFWMRNGLHGLGVEHTFLLPLLVAGILFLWHLCGKFPWRLSAETFVGMFAESLLFAFCLVVIAQLQDLAFRTWIQPMSIPGASTLGTIGHSPAATHVMATHVIAFVGAGVYEEVMFRLLLLPLCFMLFRLLLLPGKWATILAVVTTSLLFAFAHYVGPGGESFSCFTFTFRSLAGIFFAGLFVIRGFGITVGCHAAYDLLVGILLVAQNHSVA